MLKYKYILFVFVITSLLTACESKLKEIQNINKVTYTPVGIAEKLNLKYTDSGKIKAVLISPKMLDFSNLKFKFNEFPKGIHLTLYQDSTNTTVIKAQRAFVYNMTHIIDLQGKVNIKTSNGQTLETEQLYYDQKNEWFFTEKKYKFTDTKGTSTGQGIDFSKDFKYIATQRVSGEMDSE